MKISTKGRYALRVMIDLAEHKGEGCIPLKDIAARQEISKKYLEIIVKELVLGKMVAGRGGHGGGNIRHHGYLHRYEEQALALVPPYSRRAF